MRRLALAGLLGCCAVGAVRAQHDGGAHAGHGAPVAAAPAAAAAAGRPQREWTRQPLIVRAGPMREGDRNAVNFAVRNLAADSLEVHAPEGPAEQLRRRLPLGPDGARVEALPRVGNYYWLVARQESAAEVRVASAPHYFSNPGAAPSELLLRPKHELELIPQPLPREHANYREAEKWEFLVRFEGKPLPGKSVVMETEAGSRLSVVSDKDGLARVVFPRDFKPAEGGEGHRPRRAGFVLSVEHEHGGRRYLTSFNHGYGPDGERGRSLAWGAGFGLLGMTLALPLLRRRNGAAS